MSRTVSNRTVARAFAQFLSTVPSEKRFVAIRACARYLQLKRRLHDAEGILQALDAEMLAQKGKRRVVVAAADPLSRADARAVEERLGALLDAHVTVRGEERPHLLAGFRAEVDGLLVDASLRGVLSRLRSRIRSRAEKRSPMT